MGFGIEELQAVERVMKSGILSEYQGNFTDNFYGGPEIKALEKEWAEYFGVKHAIACNSATSGLWMALNSIYINPREEDIYTGDINYDEVIVSPYTMTCSASLPLLFDALPVFADIEPDYFCIDPVDVEKKITKFTKAIIAVDIFGQPCDFDRINEIAERKGKEYGHKIYVIEDAAQAPGAKYKGRYAGTLGDIGVFSLNRHKHIHCGEGGVVVTNDDDLAFKIRLSMNHAEAVINDKVNKEIEEHGGYSTTGIDIVGMNLRMTELLAAIAREQLKKLDGIVKKHQEDAKMFPVKIRPECEHAFYRYAWTGEYLVKTLIPDWEVSTVDGILVSNFIESNFNSKRHYITPLFQMPLFQNLWYDQKQCPVVREVDEKITLAWKKVPY